MELSTKASEVFIALFLDTHHRLICTEQLFSGTLRHTNVYPREIVRAALDHNAAAIVLAHNHPTGTCEPSESDITLTNTLKSALNLVDVNIIDHMIIAQNTIYSFAEHGQL